MDNKPNTGALFKNANKKNDKQPDYRGPLHVACPHCGEDFERELAAWLKKSKKNVSYMSLSLNEPYKKDASKASKPADEPFDDHIPFSFAYAVPLAGLFGAMLYAKDVFQVWG